MKEYIVNNNIDLYNFLRNALPKLSKNSIKNLISNKKIYVNNTLITRYNYELNNGDKVIIKERILNNIEIIYEDKNIIVINKPSSLLTISTQNEKIKTAYHYVSEYLKSKNKNNKVFVIHRLDKDTSGIVMFAKNEKIKKLYQNSWDELVKKRRYYAIIEGIMKNKCGTIKSYLIEENNYVHSTNKDKGKLSITEYKVLKEKNNISMLDINLKTGRKNQIRVHMKENNTPILGDKKYGRKTNLIKRMALHAYKLEIIDPISKNLFIFETSMPKEFNNII